MTLEEVLLLIERARLGDREAFGELVLQFQPAVYAVALARLRDVNEAVELTQEVFIHAMTKLEQLRDPHCFVGWLRQITVRMALNRVTRRAPLQGAEPEVLQNAPDRLEGPLDGIIRAENRHAVWIGLENLKETDRVTLVAFYIQGRSLKQMAREFATPIGTIKRRLHVARGRLRKQLERAEAKRGRARSAAPWRASDSPMSTGRIFRPVGFLVTPFSFICCEPPASRLTSRKGLRPADCEPHPPTVLLGEAAADAVSTLLEGNYSMHTSSTRICSLPVALIVGIIFFIAHVGPTAAADETGTSSLQGLLKERLTTLRELARQMTVMYQDGAVPLEPAPGDPSFSACRTGYVRFGQGTDRRA